MISFLQFLTDLRQVCCFLSCFIFVQLNPALFAQDRDLAYFLKGNFLAAAAEFEERVQKAPTFQPGLHYYLGNSYLELGRIAEELYSAAGVLGSQYYESRTEKVNRSGPVSYYAGLCRIAMNDRAGAAERFEWAASGSGRHAALARIWLSTLKGRAVNPDSQLERLESQIAAAMLQGSPVNIDPGRFGAANDDQLLLMRQFALRLLTGEYKDSQSLTRTLGEKLSLADHTERTVSLSGGQEVDYLFFFTPALKCLSHYYLKQAGEVYTALEPKVLQADSRKSVRRKAGLAKVLLDFRAAAVYLQGDSDLYLQALEGISRWRAGEQEAGRELWLKVIRDGSSAEAAGLAGFWLSRYGARQQSGFSACERANSDFHKRNKRYDQELVAYLAELYADSGDLESAAFELDRGYDKQDANQPLFLLRYAMIMYKIGSTRHPHALDALFRLQDRTIFARQVHYFVQGLVAASIKQNEGRGVKALGN